MKLHRAILPALIVALLIFSAHAALAEGDGQTAYRALLIGIDNYASTPIEGCRTDVNRMTSLLQYANEAGGRYLTPATRTNLSAKALREQVADMLGWNVDNDDVTLIYYAGLGVLQNETDAALVAQDGETMRLRDLRTSLDQLPGTKLVVFDFRYRPGAQESESRNPTQMASLFNRAVANAFSGGMTERDYQLITAATVIGSAEQASAALGLPCGPFTYFLTQACGYDYMNQNPLQLMADVNQNGAISLAEARDYTEAGFARLSRDSIVELHRDILISPVDGTYPLFSQRTTTETLSVVLDRPALSLAAGTSDRLTASVLPVNTQQRSVFWVSSDLGICSVDQSGYVTAVRPGTAEVTCVSANGMTDSCTVMVRDVVFAESVSLNASKLVIGSGQTQRLLVTIKPQTSNELITWTTSDSSVATVDQDGVVSLIRNGTAIVTATTESGKEVSCAVVAVDPKNVVTDVAVDNANLTLYEDQARLVMAKVKPGTATDQSVRWSTSDDTVANVEANGLIAGVGAGECIVTCTASSGVTAQVRVTVRGVDIEIQPRMVSVKPGKRTKLSYVLKPEQAELPVTWESADESIATVDEKGEATAVSEGQTEITATLQNGQTAVCKFSVAETPVKGIKLNKEKIAINAGASAKLKYKLSPAKPTIPEVTWSSSNENVLSVSEDGTVTAIGVGRANVIVRAHSGKGAKCEVTVRPPKIKRISMSSTAHTFRLGADVEHQLEAIIEPATDLGNRALQWKSSNKKVATVNADGLVTIVGEGKATIRATNGKLNADCKITVTSNRTYHKNPQFGDERKLYTSLRQVAYSKGDLIIQLFFSNRTKSPQTAPEPGTLHLTLLGGQSFELDASTVNAPITIAAGKHEYYTYSFSLDEHPDLRDLDLSDAQVSLLPPS